MNPKACVAATVLTVLASTNARADSVMTMPIGTFLTLREDLRVDAAVNEAWLKGSPAVRSLKEGFLVEDRAPVRTVRVEVGCRLKTGPIDRITYLPAGTRMVLEAAEEAPKKLLNGNAAKFTGRTARLRLRGRDVPLRAYEVECFDGVQKSEDWTWNGDWFDTEYFFVPVAADLSFLDAAFVLTSE